MIPRMPKKSPPEPTQIDLFGIHQPTEEEKPPRRPPSQPERSLMQRIQKRAADIGLPSVHIQNFCGNKFYPQCTGTSLSPHPPERLICPICKRPVLATCRAILNSHLAGQFDILGIAWAIETKHRTTKRKPQAPKPSPGQQNHALLYRLHGIPHIMANETDIIPTFHFLDQQAERLTPTRVAHNLQPIALLIKFAAKLSPLQPLAHQAAEALARIAPHSSLRT